MRHTGQTMQPGCWDNYPGTVHHIEPESPEIFPRPCLSNRFEEISMVDFIVSPGFEEPHVGDDYQVLQIPREPKHPIQILWCNMGMLRQVVDAFASPVNGPLRRKTSQRNSARSDRLEASFRGERSSQ
jgi:hypothetical protein